jgi:hypothetical protein
MLKRTLYIIVLLFCCNTVLSLFSSCRRSNKGKDTSGCKPTACLITDNVQITAHNVSTGTSVLDKPVKATDLLLNVHIAVVTGVCYKAPAKQDINLSLFSSAYAYMAEPMCPILQSGDSIVAYNIYSDKSFDAGHPAGSSLNDIISTDDIPVPPLYNKSQSVIICQFYINSAPADEGEHIFTVELTQKDGDVVKVSTWPIKLLK